jgi:hypothetical protein
MLILLAAALSQSLVLDHAVIDALCMLVSRGASARMGHSARGSDGVGWSR